jgi:hypothetical protein
LNRLYKWVAKDPSLIGMLMRRSLTALPSLGRTLTLKERLILGQMPRIYYAYAAVRASELAMRLGYKELSILEFGVAGGNGLIALEEIKTIIERFLPIKIRIYGFDLGSGLPKPMDFRDLPYHWQGGFYEMDVEGLKRRLKHAELMIGPVAETIPQFLAQSHQTAPIGMISFDLDYYSSTVDSFRIFEIARAGILPRVMCYMDDVSGTSEWYSDFTGERLAIAEFNQRNESRKISRCYDFEEFMIERWQEKIMIYHDFNHPLYDRYAGNKADGTQLPLTLRNLDPTSPVSAPTA